MPSTDIQKKKKMFSIPFLLHEDDISDEYHNIRISKICTSAMLDLLGKRRRWRFVCREHAKNNTVPSHALKGRTPYSKRKWNTLLEEDLKTHFDQLKQEAEPIATGVVRELTGETNLRDVAYVGIATESPIHQNFDRLPLMLNKSKTKTTEKGILV
jgi:hypothetical protein